MVFSTKRVKFNVFTIVSPLSSLKFKLFSFIIFQFLKGKLNISLLFCLKYLIMDNIFTFLNIYLYRTGYIALNCHICLNFPHIPRIGNIHICRCQDCNKTWTLHWYCTDLDPGQTHRILLK